MQRVKRIYPRSHSNIVPELGPEVKLKDSQFGFLFLIDAGFLYPSESQQFSALDAVRPVAVGEGHHQEDHAFNGGI